MSHVRTQIRNAFKAALEAHPSATGYTVFASRKYSLNVTDDHGFVDIMASNDQTEVARSTMGVTRKARMHTLSVYIRVQRNAASDDLDDLLDDDELFVVDAVHAYDWTGLLEEEPELLQTNFIDSNDSRGTAVGTIVIRFDVTYRIEYDDPETVIA
jgi:hypothetical protein